MQYYPGSLEWNGIAVVGRCQHTKAMFFCQGSMRSSRIAGPVNPNLRVTGMLEAVKRSRPCSGHPGPASSYRPQCIGRLSPTRFAEMPVNMFHSTFIVPVFAVVLHDRFKTIFGM